jgi:hypothetical protein
VEKGADESIININTALFVDQRFLSPLVSSDQVQDLNQQERGTWTVEQKHREQE